MPLAKLLNSISKQAMRDQQLNDLREEYRGKMNEAGSRAQRFAEAEEFGDCALACQQEQQYAAAWRAVQRAIKIIEDA